MSSPVFIKIKDTVINLERVDFIKFEEHEVIFSIQNHTFHYKITPEKQQELEKWLMKTFKFFEKRQIKKKD